MLRHQYIERRMGRIGDEVLIADNWVHLLYGSVLEKAPLMSKAMTSARTTRWLVFLNIFI